MNSVIENSLELKNVSKSFDKFKLEGLNFTLPKGCIMGYIGENGAGKSTTIKLILDLISKDSGEILVFGKSHLENQGEWKQYIGAVLEDCYFPDSFKIKDINLVMKNTYKNWEEQTFFNYCKKFSLEPQKIVKNYSRGMKMKLSIAVALSHKAKLLILDEATGGLDPIIRDEILTVFLDFIQDEENSVLISSHIISDLEKICDYITLIHQGKIILSQPKDEMLAKYAILKCSQQDFANVDKNAVIGYAVNSFGVEALVIRDMVNVAFKAGFALDTATIEDILLYYVKTDVKK